MLFLDLGSQTAIWNLLILWYSLVSTWLFTVCPQTQQTIGALISKACFTEEVRNEDKSNIRHQCSWKGKARYNSGHEELSSVLMPGCHAQIQFSATLLFSLSPKRTRVRHEGFPRGSSCKETSCQCRRCKRYGFDTWLWKIPWRRAWQPTPVFLPGESYGERSLAGCGP